MEISRFASASTPHPPGSTLEAGARRFGLGMRLACLPAMNIAVPIHRVETAASAQPAPRAPMAFEALGHANALGHGNAPGEVLNAVHAASAETGVDFAYLMDKARAESSYNTQAQARTSSAKGLFQFIESTWLAMVRDHGAKHGLAAEAARIDGRGRVADPAERQRILDLRTDPEFASRMAAEFAAGNAQVLEANLGRPVGPTELYFAHFLGASGATGFLKAHAASPEANAAEMFPAAAKANRGVFFEPGSGKARTLDQVYAFFDAKFDHGATEVAQAPVRERADRMVETLAQALVGAPSLPDFTPLPGRKPMGGPNLPAEVETREARAPLAPIRPSGTITAGQLIAQEVATRALESLTLDFNPQLDAHRSRQAAQAYANAPVPPRRPDQAAA